MKNTTIKKGSRWICLKEVIMKPIPMIAYKEGKIYISEYDNCITDEFNDKNHSWLNGNRLLIYFKKIKGNKIF